jgi:hypothetical protein
MPTQLLQNVNFGRSKYDATGSLGVGYSLLGTDGTVVESRTTTGVYQTAPGIYAAYVSFPDNFKGQILWDTGDHYFLTASYATEDYNGSAAVTIDTSKIDEIHTAVMSMSGTLNSVYDIQFGRWRIVNNQMIFYKDDNTTEVVRFDLFDDAGNPTMDAVFERVKV